MKELGHCFPKSTMVSSYSTDKVHIKNVHNIYVLSKVFFDKIRDHNINWIACWVSNDQQNGSLVALQADSALSDFFVYLPTQRWI